MDIRAVFGLNMRRLRLPKRLSQEAAGDLMKIDRAHISRIERGLANITILNIAQAARVLECEWAELFDKRAAVEFAASLKGGSPRTIGNRKPARKRR